MRVEGGERGLGEGRNKSGGWGKSLARTEDGAGRGLEQERSEGRSDEDGARDGERGTEKELGEPGEGWRMEQGES